jgi:integrase
MADKRVARGIWQTASGWRVYVRADGKLHPKRLPATMTLGEVKRWREGFVVDLRRKDETSIEAGVPGTFADDVVQQYLPAVRAMTDYKERARHMGLWVAEFGAMRRLAIKPVAIRTVRDRWLTVGPKLVMRRATADAPACRVPVAQPLSASQVNKRLRALENFFTVLDGRQAKNPVREVPEADEGDAEPRALPWPVVEAILAAMPDRGRGKELADGSKTKARLRVIAWTGLSHAQLARLTSSDLDFAAGTLFLQRRRKGKPGKRKGRTIPLLPEAIAAFRAFDDLKCWGAFSRSSLWKSFQRAAKQLKLEGVRPYDLRHSFGTRAFAKSGDETLVQELLGHEDRRTTRRYTEAAVNPHIATTFAKFKARLQAESTAESTTGTATTAPATTYEKPVETF